MKYDYSSMDAYEILKIYFNVFGDYYQMSWESEPEYWLDDIVECIESGKPQDMSDEKYPWNHPAPEGCIE